MSKVNKEVVVEEVKLTNAEVKAAYAVAKEEAKAAHDPANGKFVFETAAEYKNAYNAKWDLAHPNEKDALPSTDDVLKVVDEAIAGTVVALEKVKVEETVSKASLARAIFAEEVAAKGVTGLVRKDILTRFMVEAGCTKAGANTYYNTCRDKAGLVNHKS